MKDGKMIQVAFSIDTIFVYGKQVILMADCVCSTYTARQHVFK